MKKDLWIPGFETTQKGFAVKKIRVQITNDKTGKTLSIGTDDVQFTIAFEQIERYLK